MPNSTPNSKPAKIWATDYPVTETLVRGLLDSQFPELMPLDLRLLGEGCDNTAYLVNSEFVFRFPRRKMALELLMNEARLLPLIAPHLPVAVPAPKLIGAPTREFPCPFSGYRLIPGVTACSIELDDSRRSRLAVPIGELLRALHTIPVTVAMRSVCPGDLYVRHLLLNELCELTGVIDWGDVHLGDPAVDLMIAYSFLPLSA